MGCFEAKITDVTPLAAMLKQRIARDGPLSVHDYMASCISDARAGYYARRQPIGRDGDFITAPEVSQMFGELIGVWIAAIWQSLGRPRDLVVAELGPGRGTLMADAMRAMRSVSGLTETLRVALIETSAVLREVQREALAHSPIPLDWYARIDDLPQGPLVVIANEFIDALPVRQLLRERGRWHERSVTLSASSAFAFCAGAAVDEAALPGWARSLDASDGNIVEMRPATISLLESLAARAKRAPMAALMLDYGHEQSAAGDTLQAVFRHCFADPLAAPGEADLTAHVDFAALKDAASELSLSAYGPMPQGEFLLKLGLEARCQRLTRDATPAQQAAILAGAARLADPRQMGVLFKALALQSSGLAPPPPFGDI
jgi:NADH dehydrogenase [ubiquinone] 1 alpha subcomplex assembly factor 7